MRLTITQYLPMKRFHISLLLNLAIALLKLFPTYSQSIINDGPNYSPICVGSILNVPVTLTGTFSSNNRFTLNLINYARSGDTTIHLVALNNESPLQFQLPNIVASSKTGNGYIFQYSISSTSPIAVSNEKTLILNLTPSIALRKPLQRVPDFFGSSYDVINDYCSVGSYRKIPYELYAGNTNNDTYFETNTNTRITTSYSGILQVTPTQNTTYQISQVANSCGSGQIIQPNNVSIKINPFKIKITDIFPTIICEEKKINVYIDYEGVFDSSNQFFLELANRKGDTIRVLTTTMVNQKQFSTTLSDSLTSGVYFIRLRATNPDLATDYFPIRVYGKPNIALGWPSVMSNPIDYKKNIPIRIVSWDSDDIQYPLFMKFSDGTKCTFFTGISGGRMADIVIKPTESVYFKLDSLVMSCGTSKKFTITGERNILVNKDFYVEDLPKNEYCTGETVRLKLTPSIPFGSQNSFRAKIMIERGSTVYVPVLQGNEGYWEFTIPDDSYFEGGSWLFTFQIEGTNPTQISTVYHTGIVVHRQPDLRIITPTALITSPNITSHYLVMKKGVPPASVVLTNGQYDFTTKTWGVEEVGETYESIGIPVLKSTNFKIKSISNSCGTKQFSPTKDFTIAVQNQAQRVIYLKKAPTYSCLGASYRLEIDTVGIFQPNDEFIVKLVYTNLYSQVFTYEIGRARSKFIDIQIPSTIPLNVGLNTCSIVVSSTLTENENLAYSLRSAITQISSTQSARFVMDTPYPYINQANSTKLITLLNGESLGITVESQIVMRSDTFRVKINNKWFTNNYSNSSSQIYAQPFISVIKPVADTILALESMEYRCGITPQSDTIKIVVKKNIIEVKAIQFGFRCQNSLIDIYFNVEGDKTNLPPNFRFYFIPDYDKSKRFEAEVISSTSLKTTLKIPDMPYEGFFRVEVVPTLNQNDFFIRNIGEQIYIRRTHSVKISGKDGSSIAWADGQNSHVPIKFETLTSFNPSWYGVVQSNAPYYYYDANIANDGSRIYFESVVSAPGYTYSLKSVESDCGYGSATGNVTVKNCYKDLQLPFYNAFGNEYFSSTYIKSYDSNNTSTLYSSQSFVDLLPGFISQNPTTLFDVQILGCPLVP